MSLEAAYRLEHYQFQGRAGELQQAGAWPELVAELGDNYATYHDSLAKELVGRGPTPDAVNYRGRIDAYLTDVARLVDVVRAEAMLRQARAYQLGIADAATAEPALFDERHRLISVETGAASGPPVDDPLPQTHEPSNPGANFAALAAAQGRPARPSS